MIPVRDENNLKASRARRALVLAYGSLVAEVTGEPARLRDHRRTWGVAMDNHVTLPGYKHYEHPDGSRPAVHVCFLDLLPAPGWDVAGVVFEVAAGGLADLDARERNYRRVDVGPLVEPAFEGPVWTYVGTERARARRAAGVAAGTAVVCRSYLEAVAAGLAPLGPEALADASPQACGCPVIELRRVDALPAGGGARGLRRP